LHRQIDQEFGRLTLPLVRPIRSTNIRQRLQTGTAPEALATMMPEPVVAYIRAHQLYRDETSA
jgi:nicotinic acid mononucleotide adenylyltransferase